MKLSEFNKRLEDPKPIKWKESIKLYLVVFGLAIVIFILLIDAKIRSIWRKI